MTDKQIDELIERALKAEQTLPEGLSRRRRFLPCHIVRHAK